MNTPDMTVRSAQDRLTALREEARVHHLTARPRSTWRFELPGVVLTVSLRTLRQTA